MYRTPKKDGYNINTDTVVNCFSKRFGDLLAILPYCNEATFYDNSNGFSTVEKYKNGEFLPIGQDSPKWLLGLIEKMK